MSASVMTTIDATVVYSLRGLHPKYTHNETYLIYFHMFEQQGMPNGQIHSDSDSIINNKINLIKTFLALVLVVPFAISALLQLLITSI